MPTKEMRNRRAILILIPILIVATTSGCTTWPFGGGAISGNGVVITGWEAELGSIFSGERLDLDLEVQNQGERRARNVVAEIINIDTNEWGSFGFHEKSLGDLIPYDPVTQTPGETKSTQFTNLIAPELPKGSSFVYEPTVRVSYDYTTTAQKPITIVDKQELVKIQQQGKTLPNKITEYSAGPIAVDIIMGNFVKTSGTYGYGVESYDIFPVQIKITNMLWESGGTVTAKGAGFLTGGTGYGFWDELDYPILIKIKPPAGTNFVYSGYGDYDCSESQFSIDLFKGKDTQVTCELEVTSPPTAKTESLIQVELDYRYYIDAVAQVAVQGTKESGSFF
jgi:hypothetical protein